MSAPSDLRLSRFILMAASILGGVVLLGAVLPLVRHGSSGVNRTAEQVSARTELERARRDFDEFFPHGSPRSDSEPRHRRRMLRTAMRDVETQTRSVPRLPAIEPAVADDNTLSASPVSDHGHVHVNQPPVTVHIDASAFSGEVTRLACQIDQLLERQIPSGASQPAVFPMAVDPVLPRRLPDPTQDLPPAEQEIGRLERMEADIQVLTDSIDRLRKETLAATTNVSHEISRAHVTDELLRDYQTTLAQYREVVDRLSEKSPLPEVRPTTQIHPEPVGRAFLPPIQQTQFRKPSFGQSPNKREDADSVAESPVTPPSLPPQHESPVLRELQPVPVIRKDAAAPAWSDLAEPAFMEPAVPARSDRANPVPVNHVVPLTEDSTSDSQFPDAVELDHNERDTNETAEILLPVTAEVENDADEIWNLDAPPITHDEIDPDFEAYVRGTDDSSWNVFPRTTQAAYSSDDEFFAAAVDAMARTDAQPVRRTAFQPRQELARVPDVASLSDTQPEQMQNGSVWLSQWSTTGAAPASGAAAPTFAPPGRSAAAPVMRPGFRRQQARRAPQTLQRAVNRSVDAVTDFGGDLRQEATQMLQRIRPPVRPRASNSRVLHRLRASMRSVGTTPTID